VGNGAGQFLVTVKADFIWNSAAAASFLKIEFHIGIDFDQCRNGISAFWALGGGAAFDLRFRNWAPRKSSLFNILPVLN